jgi:hypothetical protein
VEWVNKFWNEMIVKKTIDRKTMEEKHRLVKVASIKHTEAKEIGTEWICANTWNQLQLNELFKQLGWSEEKIQLAMTQVISRAVYPGSELATSKWIQDNSAICDITGYDVHKITKDGFTKVRWIYINTKQQSKNICLPPPMNSLICKIESCCTILPTPILKTLKDRANWPNMAAAKKSAAMPD